MSVVIIGGHDRMVSQYKMIKCAVSEAGKCNADVIRCHTSSQNALNEILYNVSQK